MSSSFLRRTSLCAALATGVATLVAIPPTVAAPSSSDETTDSATDTATVDLSGTLLVLAGEDGEPDSFSVRRPNGQVVPIDPGTVDAFDHDVAGSNRFAGRVELPVVNGRATSLRAAAQVGTPLRVTSASIHARPTTSGPVVHRVAIAQVNNLGAYTTTVPQFMASVRAVADYWTDQADGQIASYEIAAAPVSFATTKTTVATGCGLAGDQTSAPEYGPVVQEAAALFPGYDFFNGTDQLVVLTPEACRPAVSGAAGRGDRNVSLSSGGSVIVSSGANFNTILSHEWGHNYGLTHAKSPTEEYGNLYEVMGSGPAGVATELGTGYRHEEGLLQAGEVTSLTGASASATIRDRAAVAETGVRSVEVIDPDNGTRIWFDLRTGTGSDTGSAYAKGPTVYGQAYRAAGVVVEQDADAGVQLQLPGGNSALAAGETWTNASGTMKVGVSALDAAGGTASLTSTFAPGAAVSGGSAAIVGTARPYEKATATSAGFVPAAKGVRYQWFANGAPIPNEDSATFDVPLSLVGASLSVQAIGYATGAAPSAPVMSPAITVPPAAFYAATGSVTEMTIAGKTKTGQVLSTNGLSWVGDNGLPPAGLSSTFQWYRGRKAIKGATAATYRLKSGDLGQSLYVRNNVSAPGFESDFASARGTARVKKGKLPSATPKIKFKGKKAKAGTKLKVKTGRWVGKTRFRFQWYAGKRKIRGADNKTLKVSRGLRKKKVSVRVTGSKKGYKTTSRKSKSVKIR